MAGQKNVQEQDINQLLKVRRDKLADLQANGKDPFQITKFDVTHHSVDIKEDYERLEGTSVTVAGRMMFKRVMGKASFCNVQDLKGNLQIYVARDSIGEDSNKDFKKYDVGDILGITGEVFKTKTGEISVHASSVTLLSKSLQILPEKFHGLTDTDMRYRQRYVDLIMNQEVKDTFVKRSKVISSIRKYLDAQGFMEVETPMLVSNAGGDIVERCVNNAAIRSSGTGVGGIIGLSSPEEASHMTDCHNYAEIQGGSAVGGLVGYATRGINIEKSCNEAPVSAY